MLYRLSQAVPYLESMLYLTFTNCALLVVYVVPDFHKLRLTWSLCCTDFHKLCLTWSLCCTRLSQTVPYLESMLYQTFTNCALLGVYVVPDFHKLCLTWSLCCTRLSQTVPYLESMLYQTFISCALLGVYVVPDFHKLCLVCQSSR